MCGRMLHERARRAMTSFARLLRFALSVAFLACVIVIVLFNAEIGLSSHRPAAVVSPLAPSHRGSSRVFVFAIDSLRYQTAMDPKRMPHLAALRSEGTFAKTSTTNDAVTVPSMRAAFSGRDHVDPFRVFGNFARGAPLLESIFDETRSRGVRTLIMSDGSFDQFGGARVASMMDNHAGGGDEVERQIRAFDRALSAFVAGRYDFVVAHVTFGDHAGHAYGVHRPDYDDLFRDLDRLVKKADKNVGRDATLVVMGDHGHTEEGNHGMGLDVPTFLLYRGPAFARGLDLGTVSITDHRYFLSHALSVPLAASYDRGRYPEALVSEGPLPASFAAKAPAPEAHGLADYPPSERVGLALVVASVGVLAYLWLATARKGAGIGTTAGLFIPLALLGLVWIRPFHALASLAASALFVHRLGAQIAGARRRAFKLAAFWSLGALVLFGWGIALAALRPLLHEPRGFLIDRVVAAAAVVTALATVWRGSRVAMGGGLLVVGVLCYPTVYRYGAPSLFVPLWLCWLLSIFVAELASEVRALRGRFASFDLGGAARNLGAMLGIGGAVAIGLLPFYRTYANQFCFEEWHGPLAPETNKGWLVAAIFAKAVLFFRPFRPPRTGAPARALLPTAVAIFVAAIAIAGLSLVEWRWLPLRGAVGGVSVAALGALAWVTSRRCRRAPTWQPVEERLRLAFLLTAGAWCLRLPGITWAWADWLFAALALSADFAARARTEESRRWVPFFVWVLGLIVAGWVSLAWTLHRFEWAFLYDFIDPQVADTNVRWFLPLLVARFAIPIAVVRTIVDTALPSPWGERRAFDALGAKVFALSAMLLGLAAFSVATDLYVEAYEELVVFALLAPMLIRAAGSDAAEGDAAGARQAPPASATMAA